MESISSAQDGIACMPSSPYCVIWTFKPIGYTPAECVEYLQTCLKDLKDFRSPSDEDKYADINALLEGPNHYRMAFAGRLDPMACGILPVIVAPKKEIGRICEEYQGGVKTYRFSMYRYVRTDTYDILGIVSDDAVQPPMSLEEVGSKKTQKYPVYSSKTVRDPISGKMRKLFEFAKENRVKEIEHLIPEHAIEIFDLKELTHSQIKGSDMLQDIFASINKLSLKSKNDFRIENIKQNWIKNIDPLKIYEMVEMEACVSSGVYIRCIANDMGGTAFNIFRIKMEGCECPIHHLRNECPGIIDIQRF